VSYLELASRMEAMGVQVMVFTDISKDGTLTGPNLEQLAELRKTVQCQVIASGGMHTIDDVQACSEIGLDGAICGKSLYSGTLSLKEAVSSATTTARSARVKTSARCRLLRRRKYRWSVASSATTILPKGRLATTTLTTRRNGKKRTLHR